MCVWGWGGGLTQKMMLKPKMKYLMQQLTSWALKCFPDIIFSTQTHESHPRSPCVWQQKHPFLYCRGSSRRAVSCFSVSGQTWCWRCARRGAAQALIRPQRCEPQIMINPLESNRSKPMVFYLTHNLDMAVSDWRLWEPMRARGGGTSSSRGPLKYSMLPHLIIHSMVY